MSRPVVSVIVPAFEAQATIKRCIRSLGVSALQGGAVEILVESDDGSSYDWVAAEGAQVKPSLATVARTGPGPTRNRALRRARGDWITYVDADDHVAPNYIDNLLDHARREGAALALTHILQDGLTILKVGTPRAALRFESWSRTGISVRGLFHRSEFPDFIDEAAQDIQHIVECTLMRGQYLAFSKAVYFLTLGDKTLTTQPGFKDKVQIAYSRHIEDLRQRYPTAPLLPEAVAFWKVKAALNSSYIAEGEAMPYYEFIARQA